MLRRILNLFLFLTCIFLLMPTAQANNIAVSNVSLTSPSTANQTIAVQFDITWSNSWRNAINYDAAWVFVKYSTDNGVTWNHATLKATGGTATSSGNGIINPTGYSSGSGTAIDIIVPTEVTSGKKGAFLQRNSAGVGTLTATGVQLVWDWNADGLSASTTAIVKVFALEMVYVPTGSFYLGSPVNTDLSNNFYAGGTTGPYQVTSEGLITIANTSGNLFYQNNGGSAGDNGSPLPAAFPKGYAAFYLMKYELAQGQDRDFLNTLTRTQQANLVTTNIASGVTSVTNVFVRINSTAPGANGRSTIRVISPIPATGPVTFGCDLNNNGVLNESSDGEWIAANYVTWQDMTAYAAWAGLRPYTELEYEKAARGPVYPVSQEFPGGTYAKTPIAILNSGQNNEIPSDPTTNYSCGGNGYSGGAGSYYNAPMRVGSFAQSSSSRSQAGASYYGALDLVGNVYELTIGVGNANARAFTGSQGTGVLSANGYATNTDWPGYTSGEVTGSPYLSLRGGAFYATNCHLAERISCNTLASGSSNASGIRLARTAP